MGELSQFHILLLVFSSVVAGVVDTLAGGGGLITVPALLSVGVPPVLALGTNKFQSCLCEISATFAFRKKCNFRFSGFKSGLLVTLIGSLIGTMLLQTTNVLFLKKLVPFFLLFIFIAHLFSKKMQQAEVNPDKVSDLKQRLLPLGLGIGFYNGFFGPGTGILWTVSLKRFLRLDLREATMLTKPLNLMGNLTALSIFFFHGSINLWVGLFMSLGAFLGGLIGAQWVIYKDLRWLQMVFNILMAFSVFGAFK